MKRLFLLIFMAIGLAFPHLARADEGWVIQSFQAEINVQADGRVKVEEEIKVDFLGQQKHGIYRDIPHTYQSEDGSKRYTQVDVYSVVANNQTIPYEVSQNDANLRIKIGDPNKTTNGKVDYKISYLATGVLNGFSAYDELYWNVTGSDWPVPILKTTARLTLPHPGIVQASCYYGPPGSTTKCSAQNMEDREVNFSYLYTLPPGSGMSVALGYAKGMVPLLTVAAPPTQAEAVFSPVTLVFFLLVTVFGLVAIVRRWWLFGRDPGKVAVVAPEYEPPAQLRPAELGVVLDERADTLDVSATIVDLASRGFITIEEQPKKWLFGSTDYVFRRTDKPEEGLLGYEKLLLTSLFDGSQEVRLSSLKNSFYTDLAKVKEELYREIARKKLFAENPESVRNRHLGGGIGLVVLGSVLTVIGVNTLQSWLIGMGAGLAVVGIFLVPMAFTMPRRTVFGYEIFRKALGYKLFVSGTEKYRQPFFENQNIFMEVLPYAIVFGVTKKLATAMKDMGIQPAHPGWYVGTHPFNAVVFASSMDDFSKSLSSAIASTPGSSGSGGGGFSGGGFGGGGGGSW